MRLEACGSGGYDLVGSRRFLCLDAPRFGLTDSHTRTIGLSRHCQKKILKRQGYGSASPEC
jgi:hypothetical protein